MQAKHPHLGSSEAVPFIDASVQLSPGDLLVFYTDGLTELKGPGDQLLTEKKVIHTIIEAIETEFTADHVLKVLLERASEFRAGTPLDDDMTLFVCEYQPQPPRIEGSTG